MQTLPIYESFRQKEQRQAKTKTQDSKQNVALVETLELTALVGIGFVLYVLVSCI